MNTENFTYYLKNPASLYQITYQEMKSMVNKYPYCQNLRFLLVKKSQIENHKNFKKDLNLAATFSPDRSFFFKQIKKNVLQDAGEDSFRLQEDYLELLDLGTELNAKDLQAAPTEDKIELEHKFSLLEEILPATTDGKDVDAKLSLEEQLEHSFDESPILKSEDESAIFLEDLIKDRKITLSPPEHPRLNEPQIIDNSIPEEPEEEFVLEEEVILSAPPITEHLPTEDEGNLAPEDFHPIAPLEENEEAQKTVEEIPTDTIEEDHMEVPDDEIAGVSPESNLEQEEENSIIEKGSVLEFLIQRQQKVEEVDINAFLDEKDQISLKEDIESPENLSEKTKDDLIESLEISDPIAPDSSSSEEEPEELPNPSEDKVEPIQNKEDIPFETEPSTVVAPSPKDSFESWMEKYHESNKKEREKEKKKKDKSKTKQKEKQEAKKKKSKKEKTKSVSLEEAKKMTASKKSKAKLKAKNKDQKKSSKSKKKKKSKKNKHAVKNIFEHKDIASETLAEILVKQESYDQAILVYKRLSLIFPEKSAYFAKKIDTLEILKNQ